MTEDEFDSLIGNRPFHFEDLSRVEADAGRFTTLGLALWGRTRAELASRLDAPRPEIPSGCTVSELRRLEAYLKRLSVEISKPQNAWMGPVTLSSLGMMAGWPQVSEGLTARLELLRRAIEYLEKQ